MQSKPANDPLVLRRNLRTGSGMRRTGVRGSPVGRSLCPLAVLVPLLVACMATQPTVSPSPTPQSFTQWAIAASASSYYAVPDWGVNRVTGAVEVETCQDDPRAWASAHGSGTEWLDLTYAVPVHATEVRIYQSLGRGAVSRVSLIDESGNVDVIWEGTDVREPCPGVLAVPVLITSYTTRLVRIDLDESRTGYWNQIDAVELVGVR